MKDTARPKFLNIITWESAIIVFLVKRRETLYKKISTKFAVHRVNLPWFKLIFLSPGEGIGRTMNLSFYIIKIQCEISSTLIVYSTESVMFRTVKNYVVYKHILHQPPIVAYNRRIAFYRQCSPRSISFNDTSMV